MSKGAFEKATNVLVKDIIAKIHIGLENDLFNKKRHYKSKLAFPPIKYYECVALEDFTFINSTQGPNNGTFSYKKGEIILLRQNPENNIHPEELIIDPIKVKCIAKVWIKDNNIKYRINI